MQLGIDIGTSGVKIIVVEPGARIVASASRGLSTARPHPTWSEQEAEPWWSAVAACLDELAADPAVRLDGVAGIGLSGQMLGMLLLDGADRPLSPCILWNDGRSAAEAEELAEILPDMGVRTGCRPNPGLVAAKLLWTARHRPEVLANARRLLLPKDYIRLKLTGEHATDPSDGSGTQLMDIRSNRWDAELCTAVGLGLDQMPRLIGSAEPSGSVRPAIAERWGFARDVVVAGGCGDNMAGAIGVGVAGAGESVITVGTSGVYCVVEDDYRPAPDRAILTHRHAVNTRFLGEGVLLAATSVLDWAAGLCGMEIPALLQAAEACGRDGGAARAPILVPYLSGNRTPHDRPSAQGILHGLELETDAGQIGWSALEGIAFSLRECQETLVASGVGVSSEIQLIGGGSRGDLWGRIIATALDRDLVLPAGRDVAAALGAARTAEAATGAGAADAVLARKPALDRTIARDATMKQLLEDRFARYRHIVDAAAGIA